HLPAAGHGVAHDVVVSDLEADDVAQRGRTDTQDAGSVAGDEVGPDQVDLGGDLAGQRTQRHVLGERHRMALHVRVCQPPVRLPHQADVADPVVRPPQQRTDQDRRVDGAGRLGDQLTGRRVVDRVDVAGVLWPHHQVGPRHLAGGYPVGQVLGPGDVVTQYL